ncbi:MAG: MmoB/DmpM family protein [Methanophagales archaeon]|nr:MmoB/DmpM family protein [Methanophagales archaeon]
MVSVFLEAVPANLLAARAVCEDPENRANNATHTHFGMLIRVKADKRLVVRRSVLEDAIGRGLTENEWQSVTWNFIGKIAKSESKSESKSERRDEQDEFVFEDSEESAVLDAYWDKRLADLRKF